MIRHFLITRIVAYTVTLTIEYQQRFLKEDIEYLEPANSTTMLAFTDISTTLPSESEGVSEGGV